ncbi:MAG: M3 family oligoendopeptidase [Vicingaceae bacterium]
MSLNTLKKSRNFVDEHLVFEWSTIVPYFENLSNRQLESANQLKQWLIDRSELSAVLEEEFAWRYIRMNVDTENETLQKSFQHFIQEINPKIAPFENKLNQKLYNSPLKNELKGDDYYVMLRTIKNKIELFREENIPLFTKLEEEAQKYGSIAAKMSIEYAGKEYTLQQAAKFLKSTDRSVREEVFKLIIERRNKDIDPLNKLFNDLIELRQKVAKNADFDNYRDYMFKAMGRFDYSPSDCVEFHNSIRKTVVPLNTKMTEKRKELLSIDTLKPWDLSVDITGKAPLMPFENGNELLEKTIVCFDKIDPFFGDCLREMKTHQHLDLESKKGKAPGGFNYPLYESGYPFIFMNAVGSMRDVTTMVHEGGHAVHSVLSHSLELVEFKSLTSEIAELASMSMELFSMDYWDTFFDNEADLKRAKRDQLLDTLGTLSWVATIDKFQHWIYTHKNHTTEERYNYWLELTEEFGSGKVDWSGLEDAQKNQWQKQLHLYEVPFYYIEYGMAQLGAIAMWRNYRENPQKTIQQYKEALALGYTKPIDKIYETAGIKFDFSTDYVSELSSFIHAEIIKTFDDE